MRTDCPQRANHADAFATVDGGAGRRGRRSDSAHSYPRSATDCATIGPASAFRSEVEVAAGEPYFSDQPDADTECVLAKTEMRDKVDVF